MITVAEINNLEKLTGLRLLWRDLWAKTPNASFFGTLDWLEGYWHRFGAGQKLRVLIVSVGGRPIGIVPLVVKPVDSGLGPVRALTYPLDSWGAFYGPLGPHPAATLSAAMKHIRQDRRDWDMIDLRYIDAESVDRGRTKNAMRGAGFQTYCRRWRRASKVDIASPWTDYWSGRSQGLRHFYTSAEHKLEHIGRISLSRWRPAGAISGDTDRRWDLFNTCVEVLSRDAGGASGNGASIALLRELHSAAVDAGMVDVNRLMIGNRVAAFAYNYHRDGAVESMQLAVSRDFPAEAGTVLFGRMIQDGFERGDRSLLFRPSQARLSHPWENVECYSYRYTHFALSAARAQALRANHCLKRWFRMDPSIANPPATVPSRLTKSVPDSKKSDGPARRLTIVS